MAASDPRTGISLMHAPFHRILPKPVINPGQQPVDLFDRQATNF